MRQSPKDLLRDHRDDEEVVLAWIADASILELQELIRLAGKTAFTMGYVFPAQMAITIRLADQAAKQSERLEKQMAELVGLAAAQKALAERLERQTNKLIWLTWGLLVFSVALLAVALIQTHIMRHENQYADTNVVNTGQSNQIPSNNK